MKMNRIIQFTTMAVFLVLLSGCKEEEKYQLRFSHYLHVTENEMGCDECHGEPGQPSFSAISHETCLDCHDEPEAEEIAAETCGMCHQEKQLAVFALPETEEADAAYEVDKVPARNIFVHTEALAGQCTDCHEYLLDENLDAVPMLERSDVLAIRQKAHASGQECITCHVDMDPGIPPASHDVAWTKRHGRFSMQDDASCSVCHTQDSCMDCHNVMQPVSHNTMFRTRTHGTLAAWNRDSCQVCHEEDSCTSCHAMTRPRSHNARWGAAGFKPTHCIGCHDTSTPGDGCATCHENGNDVMLHERYWGGAPINHNQPGIENCYICHWTQAPQGTL